MKFYLCEHCKNVAVKAVDAGVPLVCCGQKMTELVPGTSDGAAEKHLPVWSEKDGHVVVRVGDVAHPMAAEHNISFVALETQKGFQIKYLQPGQEPQAEFALADGEKVEAVYAYCNLHGLWKS